MTAEDWAPMERLLDAKRATGRSMGGEERLAKLRAAGRLNVRERVAALVDPGSFQELGVLAGLHDGPGLPADAFVCGHASIDGRPVLVGAEDGTVQGGSIGIAGNAKRERIARLARQERLPLFVLLDGAGHRLTNALTRKGGSPGDLPALADLSGIVPVFVGVHGPSAGHGALYAPLSDLVVMVDGTSQLFTAGPPIVKASTGEDIDKESLGGWDVAGPSGVAHVGAPTDAAGLALLRRLFGYFPINAWERPPVVPGDDTTQRASARVAGIIPADQRRPYDVRGVLDDVFDRTSVLELQALYGTPVVTALARLGGHPVAVVANNPQVRAGAIDVDAAVKAARFVELASSFHLPLVLLADNPGVLPGSASERAGILRAGARMFVAQHRHPGPKLHVTLRKAFGFGSSIMGQNPFDHQTVTLALPTATVGAMPAKGGSTAAKHDDDTAATIAELEASGPWRMADTLSYDDVVAPSELRNRLLDALRRSLAGRAGEAPGPVARIGHLP